MQTESALHVQNRFFTSSGRLGEGAVCLQASKTAPPFEVRTYQGAHSTTVAAVLSGTLSWDTPLKGEWPRNESQCGERNPQVRKHCCRCKGLKVGLVCV